MSATTTTVSGRSLGTACPVDGDAMRIRLSGSVAVHACDRCKGSWLSTVVNGHRAAPALVSIRVSQSSSRKLTCPTCHDVRLKSFKRHGLELDICPECRGVWFDAGELRTWLRSKQGPGNRPSALAFFTDRSLDFSGDLLIEVICNAGDVLPEISLELAKTIVSAVLEAIFDGL